MKNMQNMQQTIKPKPNRTNTPERTAHFCIQLMCIMVVHTTALNSSDNLLSYPPDHHHSSYNVT